MIRPGDRIGMGISPRVELDAYNPLRPTVYIERVAGDNPAEDVAQLQRILSDVLLPRALALELRQKRLYQELWDGSNDPDQFIRELQRRLRGDSKQGASGAALGRKAPAGG